MFVWCAWTHPVPKHTHVVIYAYAHRVLLVGQSLQHVQSVEHEVNQSSSTRSKPENNVTSHELYQQNKTL